MFIIYGQSYFGLSFVVYYSLVYNVNGKDFEIDL